MNFKLERISEEITVDSSPDRCGSSASNDPDAPDVLNMPFEKKVKHYLDRAARTDKLNFELEHKSPITALQELLLRFKLDAPRYELVKTEGQAHEPIFHIKCVIHGVNDVPAGFGVGNTKQQAKKSAALMVLNQLLPDDRRIQMPSNDITPTNPISWLYEICVYHNWQKPLFEDIPHGHDTYPYTVKCTVLNHSTTGFADSKKEAKRLAAENMWVYLSKQATTDPKVSYAELKKAKIPTFTPENSVKATKFFNNILSNPSDKLYALQNNSIDKEMFDFVGFLQDLALDHKFDVVYIDSNQKSAYNGMYRCLLQLTVSKIIVCCGLGATQAQARQDAAHNALDYIKIFTTNAQSKHNV